MTTVKISELPVLSSADAADEFVVVDDSAGVTKKITFDSLATDVRTESEPLTATTVTASGLVTASSGITFGSDTLDDYEEGIWTPAINVGTATMTGNYIKFGSLVYLQGAVTNVSDTSSSSSIELSNLPFSVALESAGGAFGERVNTKFRGASASAISASKIRFGIIGETNFEWLAFNDINDGNDFVIIFTVLYKTS